MKIVKTFGKVVLGILVGLVALFVLGYVLTIGDYAVAKTVAQDPSLPQITVDGITYHAETFGDPADPSTWLFGIPSIWTWQIIWWLLGVFMMWFLAYKMELARVPTKEVQARYEDIGDIHLDITRP